jgi:hypothetical protein
LAKDNLKADEVEATDVTEDRPAKALMFASDLPFPLFYCTHFVVVSMHNAQLACGKHTFPHDCFQGGCGCHTIST